VPCRHEAERPEQRRAKAARDPKQGWFRIRFVGESIGAAGRLVHRGRLRQPTLRFNPRPCRADEHIGKHVGPMSDSVIRRSEFETRFAMALYRQVGGLHFPPSLLELRRTGTAHRPYGATGLLAQALVHGWNMAG